MRTSAVEIDVPDAESVTVTEHTLSVELSDGRTISVPLSWYPRLLHATQRERKNCKWDVGPKSPLLGSGGCCECRGRAF